MQIFFLRGLAAAYMAFLLIDVQHRSDLMSKGGIKPGETLCDVFMYRTFADAKLFCRLPHCCSALHDIIRYVQHTLFYIFFQGYSPEKPVFTMYAQTSGAIPVSPGASVKRLLSFCGDFFLLSFYLCYVLFCNFQRSKHKDHIDHSKDGASVKYRLDTSRKANQHTNKSHENRCASGR